jgi:hypothetical protein
MKGGLLMATLDNTYFIENEHGNDVELFGKCTVFYGSKDYIDKLNADIRKECELHPVSEYDVCQKLGIRGGRKNWGWSKGKGLHEFTVQEMYPEGCPCCGRPWQSEEL